MKIKLVDGTEYQIKEFNISKLVGGDEDDTISTVHLLNDMSNSEFFESVEKDFTDDNVKEVIVYKEGIEIKLTPKLVLSKNYLSNSNGTQTYIVFKN